MIYFGFGSTGQTSPAPRTRFGPRSRFTVLTGWRTSRSGPGSGLQASGLRVAKPEPDRTSASPVLMFSQQDFNKWGSNPPYSIPIVSKLEASDPRF